METTLLMAASAFVTSGEFAASSFQPVPAMRAMRSFAARALIDVLIASQLPPATVLRIAMARGSGDAWKAFSSASAMLDASYATLSANVAPAVEGSLRVRWMGQATQP